MSKKSVTPSIKETAFDCPHCGAYTSQTWYFGYVKSTDRESPLPFIPNGKDVAGIQEDREIKSDVKADILAWMERAASGQVFFESRYSTECVLRTNNVHITECYNCHKLAVWVHDRLLYPPSRTNHPPSADLPDDVRRDYEEAQSIVDLSPRGAAALLRLCLQKLCVHLGENGKNINDDKASLVSKGLHSKVQKALDVVRVIGNEAVHPGTMDLRDDIATASTLFALVNLIVEQMITQHKVVDEIYAKLPEQKLLEIDKRNQKVLK